MQGGSLVTLPNAPVPDKPASSKHSDSEPDSDSDG